MNFWRSASLLRVLIFQAMDWALLAEASSAGPCMAMDGHHQRFIASCAIAFCAGVPRHSDSMMSKPWRWWNDSSLHTRTMARA